MQSVSLTSQILVIFRVTSDRPARTTQTAMRLLGDIDHGMVPADTYVDVLVSVASADAAAAALAELAPERVTRAMQAEAARREHEVTLAALTALPSASNRHREGAARTQRAIAEASILADDPIVRDEAVAAWIETGTAQLLAGPRPGWEISAKWLPARGEWVLRGEPRGGQGGWQRTRDEREACVARLDVHRI